METLEMIKMERLISVSEKIALDYKNEIINYIENDSFRKYIDLESQELKLNDTVYFKYISGWVSDYKKRRNLSHRRRNHYLISPGIFIHKILEKSLEESSMHPLSVEKITINKDYMSELIDENKIILDEWKDFALCYCARNKRVAKMFPITDRSDSKFLLARSYSLLKNQLIRDYKSAKLKS